MLARTESAKRAATRRRAARCVTKFAFCRFAASPQVSSRRRGGKSGGGDISSHSRGPQHGFYDPPNPVFVAKILRQREIHALVVHQAKLALVLANELLDSRAVVVAKNDKRPFDQNGGNTP